MGSSELPPTPLKQRAMERCFGGERCFAKEENGHQETHRWEMLMMPELNHDFVLFLR